MRTRGPLAAGDRDEADAGQLRQFRREPALDDVLDVGELHRRRRSTPSVRIGASAGIDLGVDRRRRQVGGQQIAGRVDRRLHFLLGDVEADFEAEAQRDDRRARRALRHHLRQARHLAELALQRRGDRRGHHLRARAGIEGLHLDGRIVDLGQRRQRQEADTPPSPTSRIAIISSAGRDRPVDEETRRVQRRVLRSRLRRSWRRLRGRRGAPSRAAPASRRRRVAGRPAPRPLAIALRVAAASGVRRWPAVGRPARLVRPRPSRRPGGRRRRRTVTLAPSRSRSTPSITTLSPAASPVAIVVALPSAGPVTIVAHGDRVVVLHDIDEIARSARAGRRRWARATTPVSVSTSRRTLTNWLGNSAPFGLSKVARILIVPVVDVDLVVVGRQRPRRELLDIGAVEGGHRQLGARIQPRRDARQIVLRRREDDADRVDLGDDDDAGRRRRPAVIARVDQPQADAAGDRRDDVAYSRC